MSHKTTQDNECEILDIRFLVPAKVKISRLDVQEEVFVEVDLRNLQIYQDGVRWEGAMRQSFFERLDKQTQMPEDTFAHRDEEGMRDVNMRIESIKGGSWETR